MIKNGRNAYLGNARWNRSVREAQETDELDQSGRREVGRFFATFKMSGAPRPGEGGIMGHLEIDEKDKTLEARLEGDSGVFSVSVGGWQSIIETSPTD